MLQYQVALDVHPLDAQEFIERGIAKPFYKEGNPDSNFSGYQGYMARNAVSKEEQDAFL